LKLTLAMLGLRQLMRVCKCDRNVMRDVVLFADRQGGGLIRGKKGLHACVKRVT
jgi:hypothetical protein